MRETIKTEKAPGAIGPYSQGVSASGDITFVSGQIPIDPSTGEMKVGIKEQTKQSLSNVKAVLEAAGKSMDDVVKTIVFLADINDFSEMNEVYNTFFTEGKYPARSAVQVAAIPKGALVEIEAIAVK